MRLYAAKSSMAAMQRYMRNRWMHSTVGVYARKVPTRKSPPIRRKGAAMSGSEATTQRSLDIDPEDKTGYRALSEATGIDFTKVMEEEVSEMDEIERKLEENRRKLTPEQLQELGLGSLSPDELDGTTIAPDAKGESYVTAEDIAKLDRRNKLDDAIIDGELGSIWDSSLMAGTQNSANTGGGKRGGRKRTQVSGTAKMFGEVMIKIASDELDESESESMLFAALGCMTTSSNNFIQKRIQHIVANVHMSNANPSTLRDYFESVSIVFLNDDIC